jgi:hypothetical protein
MSNIVVFILAMFYLLGIVTSIFSLYLLNKKIKEFNDFKEKIKEFNDFKENIKVIDLENDKKPISFNEIIDEYEKNRQIYYLELIINLMEGSAKQFMGVINLERISYGYYQLDDVIIWWDKDMCAELLKHNIASYNDSSDGLVITINKDRVNNLKNNR